MKLILRNSVSTYNDLPITGNTLADCRRVEDTGYIYIWMSFNNDDTRDNWKKFQGEIDHTADYDVDYKCMIIVR